MTVPTFRISVHVDGNTASDCVFGRDASVAENDVLVACIYWESDSVTINSVPPNWTLIDPPGMVENTSPSPNVRFSTYWHRVGPIASEPTNYTFGFSGSVSRWGDYIAAYGGVTSGTPCETGSGNTGTGTAITLNSITTQTADTLLVGFSCNFDWGNANSSSDLSERFDATGGFGGTTGQASAGASGSKSITGTVSDAWAGILTNIASVSGGGAQTINVSESITISDTPTVNAGGAFTINVSDAISISDTPTILRSLLVNVSDAASVSDGSFSGWSAPNITVSDTIGISETVTVAVGFPQISISEAINISESKTVTIEGEAPPTLGIAITPETVFAVGVRIYPS